MPAVKAQRRFKLFYFLIYVSFTTHHFLNLYFKDIGLTGLQIGTIKAASAVVMIFCQPIWGLLCDLFKMRKGLLSLLLFAAGITFYLVSLQDTFTLLLITIIIYAFFKSPIVPVSDSIVMLEVKGDARKYSQIRFWGGMALTISVVLMGYYFKHSYINNLFWIYCLFTYLALALSFFLPNKKACFSKRKLSLRDFIKLIKYPAFLNFLAAILFLQTGAFMIDGFFSLFVNERIGNQVTLGWALTVAGLSEISIYFYLGRLKKLFSARNLLITSAFVSAFRWFMYSQSTLVIQILLLQLLHGITFGFFYISAVTYVNKLLPQEFATSGQTLFWAIAFGLSSVLGSILGGYLYDYYNFYTLFIVAAGLAVMAGGIFFRYKGEN